MSQLSINIDIVNQRVTQAAQRSGRLGSDIQLVAVTKTFPPEVVTAALQIGLNHLGENKVQEAKAKKAILGEGGIWHLIGHLQTNKAKIAARLFDWIESVDSLEVAQILSHAAQEEARQLKVLLQVNVSGEGTKSGVSPQGATALLEQINSLPNLELRGLMTIAPFYIEVEKTRPVFAELRLLRDRLESQTGLHLPDLSMGMSHDFEVAIEEGATIIRLGSILFGSRHKGRGEENGI